MTPIDVIDTAVKVGLGAAISGFSAYWMGKATARDELRRERLNRHHGLLETSAEQIESFSHVILRYWALMTELVRAREQGHVLQLHRTEELTKSKIDLFNAFSDLTSAEAKLLLLGHIEAQKQLRNLGDLSKQFRREAHDGNKTLTVPKMEEFRTQLLAARASLFSEVSRVYRSET